MLDNVEQLLSLTERYDEVNPFTPFRFHITQGMQNVGKTSSDLMFWQSSGKIPATTEAQKAEYITGDDYKGYLQTIENGCIAPTTFAGISGLKSLLGDAYSSVFSGEATNEEAADTFASELDNLLEDYN